MKIFSGENRSQWSKFKKPWFGDHLRMFNIKVLESISIILEVNDTSLFSSLILLFSVRFDNRNYVLSRTEMLSYSRNFEEFDSFFVWEASDKMSEK